VRYIRLRLSRPGTYHWLDRDLHGQKIISKKPYTRRWVERHYPMVSLTPEENVPVTFNGVRWDLRASVEVRVPKIVYDIYHARRAGHVANAERFPPLTQAEVDAFNTPRPGVNFTRVHLIGVGILEPYDGATDDRGWPIGKKEPQE